MVKGDEVGGLWIKLTPDLLEVGKHIGIEEPLVLGLGILKALEDNGDEEVEEYQVDKNIEGKKVQDSEAAGPTTYCVFLSSYIVLIGRLPHALKVNLISLNVALHDCAPGVSSGDGAENTESI